MNKSVSIKKLALAGILIAVGVAASPLNFPVGASRCFPVQHVVNVLAAVFLGPWYSLGMAFVTSLMRLMMGTGTLLAFPGSMCGALLCGLAYKKTENLALTYVGEVFGTGIIGAFAAYPLAAFVLGKECALFAYVIPFGISTLGGTAIAAVIIAALTRTGIISKLKAEWEKKAQ